MQKYMPVKFALLLTLGVMTAGGALGGKDGQDISSRGTMHIKSHHSVEKTVERAKRILEHHEFRVFGIIDHSENATGAGLSLSPTKLLVFGNPKVGTALMEKNRLIGLDLPMKLLVWEDKSSVVWISYTTPDFLQQRHDLNEQRALFAKMRSVMQDISREAAR